MGVSVTFTKAMVEASLKTRSSLVGQEVGIHHDGQVSGSTELLGGQEGWGGGGGVGHAVAGPGGIEGIWRVLERVQRESHAIADLVEEQHTSEGKIDGDGGG